MELLFELLIELIVGGSLEGAADEELPKGIRIGLLIFATCIYAAFLAFFVWLILASESMLAKVVSGGVILLLVGIFIFLWRKVVRSKK